MTIYCNDCGNEPLFTNLVDIDELRRGVPCRNCGSFAYTEEEEKKQ